MQMLVAEQLISKYVLPLKGIILHLLFLLGGCAVEEEEESRGCEQSRSMTCYALVAVDGRRLHPNKY